MMDWMRGRFLTTCCFVIAVTTVMAMASPGLGQATDAGREAAVVVRVTSDGLLKNGAVLSADGSVVAFVTEPERGVYSFQVAPAVGSDSPRELFRSANSRHLVGVQGPHFAAGRTDNLVFARDQHLALAADGSRLVVQMTESVGIDYWYHFAVVDTRTGAVRLVPEALPTGLGPAGTSGYAVRSTGEGNWALSGDGRTVFWVAEARAANGTSYALIAQSLDTGAARRLAGYTTFTPERVGDGDPPGWYHKPVASPYGNLVAFNVGTRGAVWLVDAVAGGAARQIVGSAAGSNPSITGRGDYVVAWDSSLGTAVFHPTASGDTSLVSHRDVFKFPFVDGRVGLVEMPVWSSNTQEVRVVRPNAAQAVLKPGELGLPPGALFGVPSLSSAHHWTLADAGGLKALLSIMSPDGKSNDLWVLTMVGTGPSETTTGPATDTAPADGTATTTSQGTPGSISITLTWAAASPAPDGYQIFRSTAGPDYYDPDWPLTDFPVTETTFTDTDLGPGTYYYTIFPIYQRSEGQVKGDPIRITAVAQAPLQIVLKIDDKAARVGGEVVALDVAPLIQSGRTLVPLRFIGESLGATIAWDGAERKVTYTKADKVIYLWIDRRQAVVNGSTVELDVAPTIINGRTVVPLRFVVTALGAQTEWNGVTREVTITP